MPLSKFVACLKHHVVLVSPASKGYFRAAEVLRRDKSKSGCLDWPLYKKLAWRRDI